MARHFPSAPGAPPPRRANVARHPNGRINHRRAKAEEAPPRPYFVYAQRLRDLDAGKSKILMLAATTPERQLYRRLAELGLSKAHLMEAIEAAEDRRLGYPLGVLWAGGLLCPAPEGYESKEDTEARAEEAELLDKAGRIYAAQHYLVWRWQGSPCQGAPSHLASTMAEVGLEPPTEIDPEEFEKERLRLKASLSGARRALMRAAPMGMALKIIDRICIEGFTEEVHPGPLKHLRAGLRALKEYFKVRPAAKPQDRESAATIESAPADEFKPRTTTPRCPRPRMPANLTSDAELRPPIEAVAKSVARLLTRASPA
jgi:hypothetical protein